MQKDGFLYMQTPQHFIDRTWFWLSGVVLGVLEHIPIDPVDTGGGVH